MAVRFAWAPNHVRAGTYYPRVVRKGTARTDDLVQSIAARSLIQPVDDRAVLDALRQEIVDALLDGQSVILDHFAGFSLGLELKDSRLAHSSTVEITRDQVRPKIRAIVKSGIVDPVSEKLTIEQITTRPLRPNIVMVFDHNSQLAGRYTPGGVIDVRGNELLLPPDFASDAEQGVFFITDKTILRAQVYVKYGKRTITCLVPAEVFGTISIEVRTRYSSHRLRRGQIADITPAL